MKKPNAKVEAYVATLQGACSSGIEWVRENNIKSDAEAWKKLQRIDWMRSLQSARKVEIPKAVWVELALQCAEQVLLLFEKRYPNNGSVRNCIAVTRAYVNGSATKEQLIHARSAADAAAYDAYAAYAYAAAAAARAAAAAADAAADAAYAAAADAARAAADAADAAAAARAKMKALACVTLRKLAGDMFKEGA